MRRREEEAREYERQRRHYQEPTTAHEHRSQYGAPQQQVVYSRPQTLPVNQHERALSPSRASANKATPEFLSVSPLVARRETRSPQTNRKGPIAAQPIRKQDLVDLSVPQPIRRDARSPQVQRKDASPTSRDDRQARSERQSRDLDRMTSPRAISPRPLDGRTGNWSHNKTLSDPVLNPSPGHWLLEEAERRREYDARPANQKPQDRPANQLPIGHNRPANHIPRPANHPPDRANRVQSPDRPANHRYHSPDRRRDYPSPTGRHPQSPDQRRSMADGSRDPRSMDRVDGPRPLDFRPVDPRTVEGPRSMDPRMMNPSAVRPLSSPYAPQPYSQPRSQPSSLPYHHTSQPQLQSQPRPYPGPPQAYQPRSQYPTQVSSAPPKPPRMIPANSEGSRAEHYLSISGKHRCSQCNNELGTYHTE